MGTLHQWSLFGVAAAALLAAPAGAQTPRRCPDESVKVGNVCVDKYEASVWLITPGSPLAKRVQQGKADLDDLTAGGAVQLGCTFAPWSNTDYPPNFPDNGQWWPVLGSSPPSPGVYAVSIPGVLPSTCITWFQAAQACALSGKHLATNREWQDAVAGTPDGAPCVVSSFAPGNTGANAGCVSHWGAFDMVGNVMEWVADWVPRSEFCPNWGSFSDDWMCVAGASTTALGPGALIRGGSWNFGGSAAGPLAVGGFFSPSDSVGNGHGFGFRCVR